MNYVIWKGIKSTDIKGLLISELPTITKPKMRVQETTVDGVDGSIIEELGYETYDKTMLIGLTKGFDIDEVIKYFTGEGQVVFSNEPDKYYNAKIIDQIDYERLLRFRTATVKFRVQPFKYEYQEEEQIAKTGSIEGETITLDDKKAIRLQIDGKSKQETRSGKNLMNASIDEVVVNGLTLDADLEKLYLNGTPTVESKYIFGSTKFAQGTYTLSLELVSGSMSDTLFAVYIGATWEHLGTVTLNSANNFKNSVTFTVTEDTIINPGPYLGTNLSYNNSVIKYQIVSGETADYNFEPFGVSPTSDYPSKIESVGYENLFDKNNPNIINTYISSTGIVGETTNIDKIWYIKCSPNTVYTISRGEITGSRFNVGTYPTTDVMGVSINQFISKYESNSITITTNSEAKYLFVNLVDSTTKDEQIILDVLQIEKGTKQHAYVPYGKSGIEVEVTCKNKFNINEVTWGKFNVYNNNAGNFTNAFIGYENVKSNTIYSISALSSDTFRISYQFLDVDGNVLSGDYNSVPKTSHSFKNLLSPSNATKILISQLDASSTSDIKVQLEESEKPTEIEEYKSNKAVIVLNAPLRSLPNGVKDIACIKNNHQYTDRKIKSIVLDGNEDIYLKSSSNNILKCYIELDDATSTDDIKTLLCTHFKTISYGYQQEIECISKYQKYFYFNISCDKLPSADIEGFKSWLSENPVQLDYELATPGTEDYGSLTILQLVEGENNISNSEDANMIIDYIDNKLVINNKGNYTSKPILLIEGTGTIEVSVNDNKFFSYTFPDGESTVVIDSEKQDAYLGNVLKNRNMIGEFPTLENGDNIITWTGLVKGITVCKKSRWL